MAFLVVQIARALWKKLPKCKKQVAGPEGLKPAGQLHPAASWACAGVAVIQLIPTVIRANSKALIDFTAAPIPIQGRVSNG
jgi:hypothetical protein